MKIRKIIVAMASVVVVANAGFFGSNDKAYYLNHLDEAKDKMNWCKGLMMQAFKDKDEDLYKKTKNDPECNAANKALKEDRHKKIEEKRKKEEQARKEKEAKQKEAFEAEYKKRLDEFSKLDYYALVETAQKDCRYYTGTSSIFGNPYRDIKQAKCKAYKKLIKTKKEEALNKLLSNNPGKKLMEYKDRVCKNAMYGNIKCDLAREAFEKQTTKIVSEYLANKNKLKEDFNKCFYKIDSLNKKSKYQESLKVKNSFECYMPAKAAQKLNVYGYFEPIK
jgi:hypothetical protein